MSRVITFSRFFPSFHPRKGEPTYFVEKVNKGLDWVKYGIAFGKETEEHFKVLGLDYSHEIFKTVDPKYQTIRAGHRWRVGDYFSPRVWSGKPYNSKQIIIAPDIKVEKVFDFEIKNCECYINDIFCDVNKMELICKNDGLNTKDLYEWFKYPKLFTGQIICWNPNINY